MKSMKRAFAILLVLLMALGLAGCGYASAYRAIGLVTIHNRSTYSVSFYDLKGTASETLRCASEDHAEELYYTASLEEGEVNVYYDAYGEKVLLFTIKGGETLEGHGGTVTGSNRVHIVIETVGSAKNGKIRISTKPVEGE